MTLREHFVSWVDDQISVRGSFWLDIKNLAFLPMSPAIVVAWIWFDDEVTRQSAIAFGLGVCVIWTGFVFHRRKLKKLNWVEPTKFSEENGGY
ncbi:MAG TPA: hypothetical protein VHG29_00620 [Novosphingobium sp.]|nr:hypothetical protein [Novosphingobium sp.]